jgi:hypothetical protein
VLLLLLLLLLRENMVTTNASDVQVKAFLSVTVLAPNTGAGSNSTGVGAADTTGWPENGRCFHLQRKFVPIAKGSSDHFQASQVCSKRPRVPLFEPAISDGMRIATDHHLHPHLSLPTINETAGPKHFALRIRQVLHRLSPIGLWAIIISVRSRNCLAAAARRPSFWRPRR